MDNFQVRVESAEHGSSFVGLKFMEDTLTICLPLGFAPPGRTKNDGEYEPEIQLGRELVELLSQTRPADQTTFDHLNSGFPSESDAFPLGPCFDLISEYLKTGEILWSQKSTTLTTDSGRIDWRKTFKTQVPLGLENSEFIFTKFVTRKTHRNVESEISVIHKHCLAYAFREVGWLLTEYVFPEPTDPFDPSIARQTVLNELKTSNNDQKRRISSWLIQIIDGIANGSTAKSFLYGTTNFHHIWETMIDQLFGNVEKQKYYPRARWILAEGETIPAPLQIDTLMDHAGDRYVLDAKYYGSKSSKSHLPGSSDINKQITYGQRVFKLSDCNVYNAFIMPYRSDTNGAVKYEGVAGPTWIDRDLHPHEVVVGISIDTRTLIRWFLKNENPPRCEIAKVIKESALSSTDSALWSDPDVDD